MKKLLFVIALSASTFSSISMAADLAQDDRQVIETRLTKMSNAFKNNDFSESVRIMPPKLIDFLAKQSNATSDQLKNALIEMSNAVGQQVTVESYSYDLSAVQAEKSSSGRDYVFVPTHLKAKANGQAAEQKGYLLGIEDDNQWHFVNWDQQYIPIIKQVFPDLADIKAPK